MKPKHKYRIAYKVVSAEYCIYTSARCGDLQYRIGEYTKAPEGTQLFVFSSLQAARDFAVLNLNERIFKCKVRNAKRAKVCCHSRDRIKTFWDAVKKKTLDSFVFCALTPRGTLWADQVKLIEQVS